MAVCGVPRGRVSPPPSTGVEVNNGRLAMLGIFSFISEAKVPGSVPGLAGLIKPLPDLEIMGPFVGVDGVQHIF